MSPAGGGTAAPASDFVASVAAAFAPDGALARADPRLAQRDAQQRFALEVARAIEARDALVAEVGTGVGKTFAYLVPLLLSGRRALVSTATKTLQDQLFVRDLPWLQRALGVPATLALLKGRSSYLCVHRLQHARAALEPGDRWTERALAKVEVWASATRSGDLAELPTLDERSPAIPLVSSTRDNCLGAECPRVKDCHVMRARREALAADLVVVNHHLFFADTALRETGVAELLPSVDVVVFDEAHQLVETGVQFLGRTLGSAQLLDYARDLLAVGLAQARGLADWPAAAGAVQQAARELRLHCAGALREPRRIVKLRWDDRAQAPAWPGLLDALAQALRAAAGHAGHLSAAGPDFDRLAERGHALADLAAGFAQPAPPAHVRWIDVAAQQVRLVESPLDIRDMLGEQRSALARAWVFTSATLGDDDRLGWFTQPAGLDDATTLRLGSPFDYAAHARLWVAQRLPRPGDVGHSEAVGALAARCAGVLDGRTFVLTTTLRVLPAIAEALRRALADSGADIEVLVQGTQPRRALLERFARGSGCVLVGSHSFWEGVDVTGDALQCVLIDKLPFPPPNDPLVEARVRAIESRGGRPFDEYFIAEAAVALKQGAGRLIRSETDRGLLVVCDPRLRQMGYGTRLRAALPPMTELASEDEALQWLAELAAAH